MGLGVAVSVPLAPKPPKTISSAEIKVGLEEVADTVRLLAAVSPSATLKPMAAVDVPASMV